MVQHGSPDEQHAPAQDPALQEALKQLAESQHIDRLELCFTVDDYTDFYPCTNNPECHYQPLRWLLKLLRSHPRRLRCAAGVGQPGGHLLDAH
jgi:hypothetical protein